MRDDALERLLEYHRIRYYLANAWYVRFRIWRVEVSEERRQASKRFHERRRRRVSAGKC